MLRWCSVSTGAASDGRLRFVAILSRIRQTVLRQVLLVKCSSARRCCATIRPSLRASASATSSTNPSLVRWSALLCLCRLFDAVFTHFLTLSSPILLCCRLAIAGQLGSPHGGNVSISSGFRTAVFHLIAAGLGVTVERLNQAYYPVSSRLSISNLLLHSCY